MIEMIKKAKDASLKMANIPTEIKNDSLNAMAKAIEDNQGIIMEANKKDIENAEPMLKDGTMSKSMFNRLKLTEDKLKLIVEHIKGVAKLEDPIGKTISKIELDEGLVLEQVSTPIGLIAVIFEARPDALPQVLSLALKSGNGAILKGGKEARETNKAIFDILVEAAYNNGIPEGTFQLINTHEEVSEILKLDEYIDLVIPRGSNKFVKYIMDNTKIPVLGHSDGICHIYLDKYADIEKSIPIIVDAKTQYPAVCNAVETLLVHKDMANELPKIKEALKGVEIVGCEETRKYIDVGEATEKDWRTEYGDYKLSIKVVDSFNEAVDHINKYGSHHTDSILTENKDNAERFMDFVDSSCVFHNTSTRFSDGYVFGKGAEVGISTNKIHARGPVGLDGLTIYKYKLRGNGQIIATYKGKNPKRFIHRIIK